jgi:hypothetical protein
MVNHTVTRSREPERPSEPEKKERVLHTRVPESLEAELRHKAQDLGISVSNLVRNVLGHAFGLVGDVVADGHAIARAARGDAAADRRAGSAPGSEPAAHRAVPPPAIDDVLGWQPMVLGKNAVCARCNAILPRGSDAASGFTETTSARLVICLACLEQQRVAPRSEP